ncbi:MAG: archease [Planctomycetota bacterium]|nr:archease [Planctomycetota bacterium]
MPESYTLMDHTADIGIVVRGRDLAELFNNAALALFDLMIDPATVESRTTSRHELEASMLDELLNAWLARLLEDFTVEKSVYGSFAIEEIGPIGAGMGVASGFRLRASASGERFDPARHGVRREIKAVTFHELCVSESRGGWEAQVIFDT